MKEEQGDVLIICRLRCRLGRADEGEEVGEGGRCAREVEVRVVRLNILADLKRDEEIEDGRFTLEG